MQQKGWHLTSACSARKTTVHSSWLSSKWNLRKELLQHLPSREGAIRGGVWQEDRIVEEEYSNVIACIIQENGVLLPKLFWPTVRKKCSSDWEKLLEFKAEGREFANFLRSLEQWKFRTIFGNRIFFNLFLEVSTI